MSSNDIIRQDPPKKTADQMKEEIERTRSALSQDIHALGEKLSPDKMKEGAKEVIREVKHAASDSIREARDAATGSVRDAKNAAVGSLREAKDHAFESVSETVHDISRRAQHAGHVTSDFVGTHAIPLSLIGLGAGWLMLSMSYKRKRDLRGYEYGQRNLAAEYPRYDNQDWGRSGDASGMARGSSLQERSLQGRGESLAERAQYGIEDARSQVVETASTARDRVQGTMREMRHKAGDLRQQASEITHDLRDQASELGHQAYDQVSELSHQAYDQMRRAQLRTREFADENPLAVGALAIVAGVGVGLLLPSTQQENRLLGGTRDRVWNDAQQTASRLGESVQRTAGELKGALADQSL